MAFTLLNQLLILRINLKTFLMTKILRYYRLCFFKKQDCTMKIVFNTVVVDVYLFMTSVNHDGFIFIEIIHIGQMLPRLLPTYIIALPSVVKYCNVNPIFVELV